MNTENKINSIIEEISRNLASSTFPIRDDTPKSYRPQVISQTLFTDKLKSEFKQIVGEQKFDNFFKDTRKSQFSVFGYMIAKTLTETGNVFSLNKSKLFGLFVELTNFIKNGEMPFTIKYKLVNIKILGSIVIEDTQNQKIYLHNISNDYLNKNYPPNYYVSPLCLPYWQHHTVEVVFEMKGTPNNIEKHDNIESEEVLRRTITDAFLLCRFSNLSPVYSTHKLSLNFFGESLTFLGFNGYQFAPQILEDNQIETFKQNYNMLKESQSDSVLSISIDRFIIGLKKQYQHPNKTNHPNWDKIVDYVIACETLFLTINENPGESELSYRFKLNGTSLISIASKESKKNIFDGLGCLYSIRSKIVHGCKEKDVIKLVDKFINTFNLHSQNYSISKLSTITNQIEEWLLLVYNYLITIEFKERPYIKTGGWEDILWNKK